MTPRPKPKPTTGHEDFNALERAANKLVDALPSQSARDILRETCAGQHIALWMLVCGLLQKAYDSGEHSAPVLDPIWLQSNPVTMGGYAEVVCRVCNQTFRPRWPGQEFCDAKCGAVASRDFIAGERALHVLEREAFTVGNEPVGQARSTVRRDESDERADSPREKGRHVGLVGGVPSGEDPVAEIERLAQADLTP